MPETTETLDIILISGLMGMVGGVIVAPINALFSMMLKREEQDVQHKHDLARIKYELTLKHELETQKMVEELRE